MWIYISMDTSREFNSQSLCRQLALLTSLGQINGQLGFIGFGSKIFGNGTTRNAQIFEKILGSWRSMGCP